MKYSLLFILAVMTIFLGAVFFIQPQVEVSVHEASVNVQEARKPQTFEYQTVSQDPGPSPVERLPELRVPIVLHPVRNSGAASTSRSNENILDVFKISQVIWEQADVRFDVIVQDIILNKALQKNISEEFYGALNNTIHPTDNRIHIFFVNSLHGTNGIAFGSQLALVADVTTVNDFRATAHEIGHLLGLKHIFDSRARLMYQGVNGTNMTEEEIEIVRTRAIELYN